MQAAACLYLLLVLLVVLTVKSSSRNGSLYELAASDLRDSLVRAKVDLEVDWEALRPTGRSGTVVFIHSVVGVFKRWRGEGAWGFGADILLSMLKAIEESPVMDVLTGVYIGMLGSREDVKKSKRTISTALEPRLWRGKFHFVVQAEHLEYHEFPTLMVMQFFANPAPSETHIMYGHTKGVRQNGPFPSHWREYMLHWLLYHYEDGCQVVLRDRGFSTCGVLKTPTPHGQIYAGNFFWARAAFLQQESKREQLKDFPAFLAGGSSALLAGVSAADQGRRRYVAENYLLAGETREDSARKHFCLHHTHHDMQNCATPWAIYGTVSKSFQLGDRTNGDCYRPALKVRNGVKGNRTSWCHSQLPQLSI